MPHQCVKCGKLYEDASKELLSGCNCGGKFFFFMKKASLDKKKIKINLTTKEKKKVEKDVLDLVGLEELDAPVILDIESVSVMKPGKYELDLIELFKGKPLVYKMEDGKYVVDLGSAFKK
ncbi:hypothetical protein CL618_00720 [archaeon]|nr:hypothetical protein [archaeon]|tara:strand:+ start:170 stop:529 length:360 start_codon:yes stop_codon:yes gene_type:complete